MASLLDLAATVSDIFQIGNGQSGPKSIQFENSAGILTLQANPSSPTTLTLPSSGSIDGNLISQLDGFYNPRCIYSSHFLRGTLFRGFVINNNGTGSGQTSQTSPSSNRPGIVRNSTGTTTTGRGAINFYTLSTRLGSGRCVAIADLNIQTLSDATNTYTITFGFVDSLNPITHGVAWRYSNGINSGKWQGVTSSAGTQTLVDSGTTVATNTWYRLAIDINASGTNADFYLNNSLIQSVTTNIPISAGQETRFTMSILKSAGTTARTFDLDYLMCGVNI